MKKNILTSLALLVFSGMYAQLITESDFLKTAGTVIRNQAGKGTIINLRGTNLGSWLSMEYWMMPLGYGALNASSWKLHRENDGKIVVVDLQQDFVFNSLSVHAASADMLPGSLILEVSPDGIHWEQVGQFESPGQDVILKLPSIQYKRFVRCTASAGQDQWMFDLFMEDDHAVRNALYDRFGVSRTDEILDVFQRNWIQKSDLEYIKALGLNMVRVPFYWMEIMDNDGNIKPNAFSQLDWVIETSASLGLYVILDLHGAPGGINGFITSGQAHVNTYWTDPVSQQRTTVIWEAIAARYKGNPTIAAYDLLNEPLSSDKEKYPIHQFYDQLYRSVRRVDPDHIISIGAFPDYSFVVDPKVYGWKNVLYQIHAYNEAKTDKASQERFAEHVLLQAADHQSNWRVPILAGEFNFWNHPELWEKLLGRLNQLNISWSNWAYKNTRTDNPIENWGFFQSYSVAPPDLLHDDAETIIKKWSQLKTAAFVENKVLREIVKRQASVLPVPVISAKKS